MLSQLFYFDRKILSTLYEYLHVKIESLPDTQAREEMRRSIERLEFARQGGENNFDQNELDQIKSYDGVYEDPILEEILSKQYTNLYELLMEWIKGTLTPRMYSVAGNPIEEIKCLARLMYILNYKVELEESSYPTIPNVFYAGTEKTYILEKRPYKYIFSEEEYWGIWKRLFGVPLEVKGLSLSGARRLAEQLQEKCPEFYSKEILLIAELALTIGYRKKQRDGKVSDLFNYLLKRVSGTGNEGTFHSLARLGSAIDEIFQTKGRRHISVKNVIEYVCFSNMAILVHFEAQLFCPLIMRQLQKPYNILLVDPGPELVESLSKKLKGPDYGHTSNIYFCFSDVIIAQLYREDYRLLKIFCIRKVNDGIDFERVGKFPEELKESHIKNHTMQRMVFFGRRSNEKILIPALDTFCDLMDPNENEVTLFTPSAWGSRKEFREKIYEAFDRYDVALIDNEISGTDRAEDLSDNTERVCENGYGMTSTPTTSNYRKYELVSLIKNGADWKKCHGEDDVRSHEVRIRNLFFYSNDVPSSSLKQGVLVPEPFYVRADKKCLLEKDQAGYLTFRRLFIEYHPKPVTKKERNTYEAHITSEITIWYSWSNGRGRWSYYDLPTSEQGREGLTRGERLWGPKPFTRKDTVGIEAYFEDSILRSTGESNSNIKKIIADNGYVCIMV